MKRYTWWIIVGSLVVLAAAMFVLPMLAPTAASGADTASSGKGAGATWWQGLAAGTAAGAAAGSALFPGLGTLIGAAVGGLGGFLTTKRPAAQVVNGKGKDFNGNGQVSFWDEIHWAFLSKDQKAARLAAGS